MTYDTVAIIDFGGEGNQVAARLIRSMNVYCEVHNSDNIEDKLSPGVKALVLIGSGDFGSEPDRIGEGLPVLNLINKPLSNDELRGFLFDVCKLKADWNMKNYADDMIEKIRAQIGDKRALLALSGGVDSTVCAVLVHKAIGDRLSCVFVDTGMMRLNEGDEVESMFGDGFGIKITRVNAEERYLKKLKGIIEPEQKRRIIGEEFIRVFEEEAKKIGAADFLVQGTIYPDIIESGTKSSAVVKSHHNVGGLPEIMDFKGIIEPVRELFKDEVRQLGIELGISKKLVYRQPFPGPGLAVRVIGELTKDKLDLLRKADFIYREEIEKSGIKVWQYFAVLTGLRTVGMSDGKRSYGYVLALRAVNTEDAMTAEYVRLPYELLDIVTERIQAEVPEINRVVYDITGKPPGTIEWE